MILKNKYGYRFIQFVFIVSAPVILLVIYTFWGSIVSKIIEWQKIFHDLLATHINAISVDPVHHGVVLITLSFVYGVFHAVGPGHGKAVIVAYLTSHKETLRRGAVISLLAALLQAVIAVLLVTIVSQLLSIKFSEVNDYADDIAIVSYWLIMALGAFLFITASLKQWKVINSKNQKQISVDNHHDHDHDHDHACCGGHHVHQSDLQESWLQSVGVIFSMGMRPCTGAILVLIYAHLVGAFYYGIVATLVMGLGTGLAIAGLALGTQLARGWFETQAQSPDSRPLFRWNVGLWLRMAGGAFIFLVGWSLLQATIQLNSSGHPLL